MSRWIRVQTSIFEHEAFAHEPFTEREAWIWLISNAAWKDTRHRIGSEMVAVPLGSMFATLRSLQTAWKWGSDKRVRSFLARLENERMVETETDAGKTHITICNYSRYQEIGRKEDADETQAGRSQDAQKTPVHQDTNTSSLRSDVPARAPSKPTPRSELLVVLDENHAAAVIDHRQRIGKPITAHAAKLLAAKFAQCPDPNAAADAMIANGWQGFEPQWLENRSGRQSQAPPTRERTVLDAVNDRLREEDAARYEPRTIDHEPINGPASAADIRLASTSSGRGW